MSLSETEPELIKQYGTRLQAQSLEVVNWVGFLIHLFPLLLL